MKKVIKRTYEDGTVVYYRNIAQASKDVKTKFSDFAVQLLIAQAILKGSRAFKCTWSNDKI